MDSNLNFGGEKYISAKLASKNFGYTSDYIGQLCRAKKINAKLVGRSWYVSEKDLIGYKNFYNFGHKNPGKKSSLKNGEKSEFKYSRKELRGKVANLTDTGVDEQSRIAEIGTKKILYTNDNGALFPNIVKNIDFDALKHSAFHTLENALKRPKKRSNFEKFVLSGSVASIVLLIMGVFIFEPQNVAKFKQFSIGSKSREEIFLLCGPFCNNFKLEFASFKNNLQNINQNNGQLALSVFSADTLQSAFSWVKGTAYKVIRPWLKENDNGVIVIERNSYNISEPSIVSEEKGETKISQARTIFVQGSDREYVDLKIAEKFNELKNWFLINPIAPNVNRYYVTKQNDAIVSRIGGFTTITNTTTGASNLSDLSDLTISSVAYGDMIMYNGSEWVNVATSSLGIVGSVAVDSVSNADGTLTISPTTGNVVASINLSNANTWTAKQNFFGAASSTLLSANQAWFGGTGTTTITNAGWVGIGTSSPYATLSVHAGAGVDSFAIGSSTDTFFRVNHLGNIYMSTSTATTTVVGGLDIGNGAITHDWYSGETSIDNLSLGATNFDTDGGVLSWIDMPVTSSAAINTIESYTASIDGNPMITVYSESDGAGTTKANRVSIGTTTPYARLTVWATSTADNILDVLSSASSSLFLINSSGKVGVSSSTPFGRFSVNPIAGDTIGFVVGSSTKTLLSVSTEGFGTTTLAGLNISGQATTTSNVGFSITGGCYAIGTTCIGGGAGATTFLALTDTDQTAFTANRIIHTNSGGTGLTDTDGFIFNGNLGIGTTSPLAKLSVSNYSTGANTTPLFVVASSTDTGATSTAFMINSVGNVGVGTTNPIYKLDIQDLNNPLFRIIDTTAGGASFFAQATDGYSIFGALGTTEPLYTYVGGDIRMTITPSGNVGIGTTTPLWTLNPYSATSPQLALSAGAGINQWTLRNAGGNLYFSTTTVDGTATSTLSALEISGSGFGTTTVRGLNISGQATTTSNVGINLSTGCFAIGGTCITGGSSSGASTTLLADFNTFSNTNNFTGKLGLASSSPWGQLSINPNALGSNVPEFVIGSSSATHLIVTGGGNVGIGTTSPTNMLSINGNNSGTNGLDINDLGTTATRGFDLSNSGLSGSTDFWLYNNVANYWRADGVLGVSVVRSGDGSATSPAYQFANDSDVGMYRYGVNALGFSTAATFRAVFDSSGNFGVATGTPQYILTSFSSTAPQFSLSSGAGIGQWTLRNAGGNLYFSTTTVDGTATSTLSGLSILNNGMVGIATSSPTAYLSVQATASTNDIFRISSTTGTALFTINKYGAIVQNLASTSAVDIQDGSGNSVFNVDTTKTTGAGIDITAAGGQTANLLNIYQSDGTTNYLSVGPTGNFGIGTGTPSHLFTIATSTTTKEPVFDIYHNPSGATSTIGFFLSTTTGSAANVGLGLPSSLSNYIIVGNGKVQAGMAVINGGLCVDNDGWCTASTTGRISSVGLTTGGTDLAEIYFSEEVLEPGDVVAITTPVNYVKIADLSEDKNKALGVIATDPGIVLGLDPGDEQTSNQYPIALAGRVPVKVSTQNGNIEPGDYLTLSNTSGVAMKATESGNVIGRALEPYSGAGISKIIMFVDNTYYAGEPIMVMTSTTTTIYMTQSQPASSTNSIEQASTTATSTDSTNSPQATTSGLTASEGLGQIIVKFLEEIGLKIMDGITYVKNMFAEKLTVGTPEKPTGITLYDKVTGEPYCLEIVNGATVATSRECSATLLIVGNSTTTPTSTTTTSATIPADTFSGGSSGQTSTTTDNEIISATSTSIDTLPETASSTNSEDSPDASNDIADTVPPASINSEVEIPTPTESTETIPEPTPESTI